MVHHLTWMWVRWVRRAASSSRSSRFTPMFQAAVQDGTESSCITVAELHASTRALHMWRQTWYLTVGELQAPSEIHHSLFLKHKNELKETCISSNQVKSSVPSHFPSCPGSCEVETKLKCSSLTRGDVASHLS